MNDFGNDPIMGNYYFYFQLQFCMSYCLKLTAYNISKITFGSMNTGSV